MHTNSNALQYGPTTGPARICSYSLGSGSDPEDESQRPDRFDRPTAGPEDLPFKVELWDDTKKKRVEQVLAVTANGSIGYAAFYAATREYPGRYITLRHKNTTVARWNGPQH